LIDVALGEDRELTRVWRIPAQVLESPLNAGHLLANYGKLLVIVNHSVTVRLASSSGSAHLNTAAPATQRPGVCDPQLLSFSESKAVIESLRCLRPNTGGEAMSLSLGKIGISLASAVVLAACVNTLGAQAPAQVDKVAIVVNGEKILESEVRAILGTRPPNVVLTAAQKKEMQDSA